MPYQVKFYVTARGEKPVSTFLLSLPKDAKEKCERYLRLLAENGLRLASTHKKFLERDIYELRPEWGGTEYRLIFTPIQGGFVILHAIKKKTEQLNKRDLETARKRAREVHGNAG